MACQLLKSQQEKQQDILFKNDTVTLSSNYQHLQLGLNPPETMSIILFKDGFLVDMIVRRIASLMSCCLFCV